MNDIEGWGGPENLGLRREEASEVTTARSGGMVALLLGAGLWALGSMDWPGDLAFLESLGSVQGRLGSGLCVASGSVALLLSWPASWNQTG